MELEHCTATVTLKGGEVVTCSVWWTDGNDVSLIHKAKLHQGSVIAEDGRTVGLMWDA